MTAINCVEQQEVVKQLGQPAFDRIEELCKWLYGESMSPKYQIAPSIITRSECELFGISAPRFAIRKYVYEENGCCDQPTNYPPKAFFNLRRLQWFSNSIEKAHPGMFFPQLLQAELVKKGLSIADSIIEPPASYKKDFHVMLCDLAHAYGITDYPLLGVPFLQQLQIGGGMCAQACIFMSLCLQEHRGAIISGVAELTAIAASTANMSVKGLEPHKIVKVLISKECGLSAFHEFLPTDSGQRADAHRIISGALQGYSMSDVPVICLVDPQRVAGHHLPIDQREAGCIWGRNRIISNRPQETESLDGDRPAHAVLIVGCDKTGNRPHRFILNDPAKYPLLVATYDALHDARQASRERLSSLDFISVLPPGVLLPLLGDCRVVCGAFDMAECLQTSLSGIKTFGFTACGYTDWPGEWRLLNIEDEDLDSQLRYLFNNDIASRAFDQIRRSIKMGLLDRNSWYWVQVIRQKKQREASRSMPQTIQMWLWRADQPSTAFGKNGFVADVVRRVAAVFRQSTSHIVQEFPQ